MKPNILKNKTVNTLCHHIAKSLLKLSGWKVKGRLPDRDKFILIAEPHSSNWDFIIFLLVVFLFRIPIHWMGKHTLFIKPFNNILQRLGGIPVNRFVKTNMVDTTVGAFGDAGQLIIALAPTGTRDKKAGWKTGFYHIARKAGVPIVLGYIDYKNRTAGIGPSVFPTHDMKKDMAAIKRFYRPFTERHNL